MRRLALLALVPLAAGCGHRAHTGVKMLHLPYPVASLSADGTRVAVGPAQHSPQLALKTPPFVLWDPRTGHVDRFSGHGCAEPWGTTLAGRRIAFVCENSCCDTVEQSVVLLRTGRPRVVLFHGRNGPKTIRQGRFVEGIAGSGNLIVFSIRVADVRGRGALRTLLRVDGTHTTPIRHGRIVDPEDVLEGRVAVRDDRGAVLVLDGEGKVLRRPVLGAAPVQSQLFAENIPHRALVFDGRVLLVRRELDTLETDQGHLPYLALAPGGSIGGGVGGLVVYVTADGVHVLRTSDAREVVFGLGDGAPAAADLTPAGLYYASNRTGLWRDPAQAQGKYRNPSRVVFVPMREVLGRLGR